MTEYLSKKAVLDALKDKLTWASYEEKLAFEYVMDKIQSGTFDADESEIQRLRAALRTILYMPSSHPYIRTVAENALLLTTPEGEGNA